ncbi:hypothetical protein [Xanthomonas arboricola]|uniref:hypothetical protein n=1 Tax=Xanthomonas arboricola TaxID=56448 RepID=UPI0021577C7F|nr:hypothetical protein [Xanthomonas arboricola]
MINAFGEDSALSMRSVVLEYPDGCRRRYQLLSFAAADRQYVATVAKAHPARVDPRRYVTEAEPDTITPAMLANGSAKKYETQHFAFWYGMNAAAESYRDVATQGVAWSNFVNRSAAWLEKVWQMNADVLGAPMPYAERADAQTHQCLHVRYRAAVCRRWRSDQVRSQRRAGHRCVVLGAWIRLALDGA